MKSNILIAALFLVVGCAIFAFASRMLPGNRLSAVSDARCSAIHKPVLEEYGTYYRGDRKYPLFSWWYSGIVRDPKNRMYMFRLSIFPPHSSHYPGGEVALNRIDPGERGIVSESPGYKARWDYKDVKFVESAMEVTASTGGDEYFRIQVSPDDHQLNVVTHQFSIELELQGMDPVFFWNEGHPISMPRSRNKMIGFEDFMAARGTLAFGREGLPVEGDIVNERIFFDDDKWGWFEEDWFAITDPELYALLFQVKVGTRDHTRYYREGFCYLRSEGIYIPLTDLRVIHEKGEWVDEMGMKIPTKLRIEAANREFSLEGRFSPIGRSGIELAVQGKLIVEYGAYYAEYNQVLAWDEIMRDPPPPF